MIWTLLAEALFLAREFEGSATVLADALQLHPNYWSLHAMAARALAMLGEYTDALRHLRLARLLCPELDVRLLATVAYVHAKAGGEIMPSVCLPEFGRGRPGNTFILHRSPSSTARWETRMELWITSKAHVPDMSVMSRL